MSNVVEVTPMLKHSINKSEEKTVDEIESIGFVLRENTDIDFDDYLSKKIEHNENGTKIIKEIHEDENEAGLESIAKLSVDPKFASKTKQNLSKEKQQLPKTIETSFSQERRESEVKIYSMFVISPGIDDIVLPIPFPTTTSKKTLFTLKEGSKYRIKFHLSVSSNTVNNLKYTYLVWKSGLKVNQTKKMVGTFNPREEPYVYEIEEATTPSGFFARGSFLVKSKFVDDEDKCYLDTTYYFDIRKDWGV
ncbi:hypothetical protein RND81_05G174200 [Saponaria officinalis]|uniref:Rho GDP-dissociation inhibitor n=1 Tax=Saponaria officinalis TaxID=3572 RepID=A0AAW1KYS1_SAPOF